LNARLERSNAAAFSVSLAYAANDVVLIALWILAARENIRYLSVIIYFAVFPVNDLYGFFNWKRMEQRQQCG